MKNKTEMDKLAEWLGEHAAEYGIEWVHDNKPRELSALGQDWNQIIVYKDGIYIYLMRFVIMEVMDTRRGCWRSWAPASRAALT